jgi:hypothetical protein
MKLNLYIEQLVVDGVAIVPGQRHVLQTAVANELHRMLMESGISPELAKGAALRQVPADNIYLANNNPTQIGQQIARSVYGGLGVQRHE